MRKKIFRFDVEHHFRIENTLLLHKRVPVTGWAILIPHSSFAQIIWLWTFWFASSFVQRHMKYHRMLYCERPTNVNKTEYFPLQNQHLQMIIINNDWTNCQSPPNGEPCQFGGSIHFSHQRHLNIFFFFVLLPPDVWRHSSIFNLKNVFRMYSLVFVILINLSILIRPILFFRLFNSASKTKRAILT